MQRSTILQKASLLTQFPWLHCAFASGLRNHPLYGGCQLNIATHRLPIDLGPSNNQVLRPQTSSGVSNGGAGSSIESRSQEPLTSEETKKSPCVYLLPPLNRRGLSTPTDWRSSDAKAGRWFWANFGFDSDSRKRFGCGFCGSTIVG